MEAFSLLVNLRERNAELEWAAVSGEDRFVTTLITAAKETKLEVLLKEATICKWDLRCKFTAVYFDFIFQGSIQEERARHLQEDLNASREKYEKSQEEVQLVKKVIFVFPSLLSTFFIDCV